MIGQKRVKTDGNPPKLSEMESDGTIKIITSKPEIILLGATISDNISWGPHIESGEEALLPGTRQTLGVLKHIGRSIPKKSKKLLAEGLVLSRMRFLISIWGGTTERLMNKSQALLNDTARFVTNRGRRTSTVDLMLECGWMTVSEMCQHCSLLLMWKTMRLNSPQGMKDKLRLDHENLIMTQLPRIKYTTSGWRWRTSEIWNSLPGNIREVESLTSFKNLTKNWIISQRNMQVEPG